MQEQLNTGMTGKKELNYLLTRKHKIIIFRKEIIELFGNLSFPNNFLVKNAFLQSGNLLQVVQTKKCKDCSTTDRVVEQVQYVIFIVSLNVMAATLQVR
jgi:hypothetical protein